MPSSRSCPGQPVNGEREPLIGERLPLVDLVLVRRNPCQVAENFVNLALVHPFSSCVVVDMVHWSLPFPGCP